MSETEEKLRLLIEYWVDHNREHINENEKWLKKAEADGLHSIAHRIEHVVSLSRQVNDELEHALHSLGKKHSHHVHDHRHFQLHQIGVIRTPYTTSVPFQPDEGAGGDFRVILDEQYAEGLMGIETFSYILLLFFLDRKIKGYSLRVTPPRAGGKEVGLFASRSPSRPNPIGLSVVRIKEIQGNVIHTSCIDAYDGTPVLDIKPYIETLDSKIGSGGGWINEKGSDGNV
jgi:tRNA-Thr(GGU) m(6)t(6)A37 methyltransferase TsaA